MKTTFFMMLCFMALSAKAQDTIQGGRTQVFSFTPFAKDVSKVNGLALGIGNHMRNLWDETPRKLAVNGVNIEINPAGTLFGLFLDPERGINEDTEIVNNGLHISTGGFIGNSYQNGVAIAFYNVGKVNNGLSIMGYINYVDAMNGLHVAMAWNRTEAGAGMQVALFNYAATFTGIQLGASNGSEKLTGLQIGLLNRTDKLNGLQVGLWNKNGRRSLPIINW